MKKINLLVKTTDQCNLRCKYCFHEKYGYSNNYLCIEDFRKTVDILDLDYDFINIVWHGGEPLLASFDFFQTAYDICACKKAKFSFSVQTNATLLNKRVIDFFVSNKTKIGVSFDGLDNPYTRGDTLSVINNIIQLKEKGCNIGAILVVTGHNVKHLIDNYNYFKELGIGLKMNPVFLEGAAYSNPELLLNPDEYINALLQLFDYWLEDSFCNIYVSNFIELTKLILYNYSHICTFSSCLGKWLCLDANGVFYPCDRLCFPEYSLGNINQLHSSDELFSNPNFIKVLKNSIQRRNKCIENCEIFKMCYSGCNASAILYENLTDNSSVSYCDIQKGLISGIQKRIEKIRTDSISGLNPFFTQISKPYFCSPCEKNNL